MTQSESTAKKLLEVKTLISEVYIGKSAVVLKTDSGLVSFHEQVPDLLKCLPALAKAVREKTTLSLFYDSDNSEVVGLSIPNPSAISFKKINNGRMVKARCTELGIDTGHFAKLMGIGKPTAYSWLSSHYWKVYFLIRAGILLKTNFFADYPDTFDPIEVGKVPLPSADSFTPIPR